MAAFGRNKERKDDLMKTLLILLLITVSAAADDILTELYKAQHKMEASFVSNARTFRADATRMVTLRNNASRVYAGLPASEEAEFRIRLEEIDHQFTRWCDVVMKNLEDRIAASDRSGQQYEQDAMAFDNWRVLREIEDIIYAHPSLLQ